jgi:preprotein translocase subunit SecF
VKYNGLFKESKINTKLINTYIMLGTIYSKKKINKCSSASSHDFFRKTKLGIILGIIIIYIYVEKVNVYQMD